MRRNFERWQWSEEDTRAWQCSECGALASEAVHQGRGGQEAPLPYNRRQETCGPACALARKSRLQRERRAEQRERERAAPAAPKPPAPRDARPSKGASGALPPRPR